MTAQEVAMIYVIVALTIFIGLLALIGAGIAVTRAGMIQSGELPDDEAGDNLVLAVFMFIVSLVTGMLWPVIPFLLIAAMIASIRDKVKE